VATGKRVNTREACHWSNASKSFKPRKGVNLNSTGEPQNPVPETSTVPIDALVAAVDYPGLVAVRIPHGMVVVPVLESTVKGMSAT
jgi:hypothetical protein